MRQSGECFAFLLDVCAVCVNVEIDLCVLMLYLFSLLRCGWTSAVLVAYFFKTLF